MFEIFRIEKHATDFDSSCFYSKNFKHLTNALSIIPVDRCYPVMTVHDICLSWIGVCGPLP